MERCFKCAHIDGTDLPLSRVNSAGKVSESHTDTNITDTAHQRDAKTQVVITEQSETLDGAGI